METFLVVITIVAVAVAVAAFTAMRRVQRAERQRSEARVAALSAAAEVHGATDGGWKQVGGEWQWVASPWSFADQEPRTKEQGLSSVPAAASAPAIAFGTVERGESTTGRLPLFAAAALILVLGGAMLFLRVSAHESDATVSAAAVQKIDPLELVSLGHQREANALVINGTVRNPLSGHKLEGLTAVVSLLDSKGGLVSTKDVPLDYRALGPGEEAPFKLSVPDSAAVARYRVSFRAGNEMVPHVDRRSDTKLASAIR